MVGQQTTPDSSSTEMPDLTCSPSISSSSNDTVISSLDLDDCDCRSCASLPLSSPSDSELEVVDVLIVGAGPNGLALAARLREELPAALYTDLEHARLRWLKGRTGRGRKTVKGHWPARKLVPPPGAIGGTSIKVLDSSAGVGGRGKGWLGKWNAFFDNLRLEHLRSPVFFHPSPADADDLLAFAHAEERASELKVIDGVVGKEFSKHARKLRRKGQVARDPQINERSRQDYFRPSSALFSDFVTSLTSRYDLAELVTPGTVTSITYGSTPLECGCACEDEKSFDVKYTTADGGTQSARAKAVVLALGPTGSPSIPVFLQTKANQAARGAAWLHSGVFGQQGGDQQFEKLTGRQHVIVVGGGLTSCQIADLLLSTYSVKRVTLICRSHLRVKHFDFSLPWISKFANLEKMQFWQNDDPLQRLAMLKEARGGGSTNPEFSGVIKRHVAAGKLELLTQSLVDEGSWSGTEWQLDIQSKEKGEHSITADFVVCATGVALAFDQLPFLSELRSQHPLDTISGFPRLTQDLQWDAELPLFVMGAYSALEVCRRIFPLLGSCVKLIKATSVEQLGPDAPNLAGTRHGAERIWSRLVEMSLVSAGPQRRIKERRHTAEQEGSVHRGERRWHRAGGSSNFFGSLADDDMP